MGLAPAIRVPGTDGKFMNWKTSCLFLILLMVLVPMNSPAQDWRQIKPGQSRCTDLTKLLGSQECSLPFTDYELRDMWINITFSGSRKNPVVKQALIGFRTPIKLRDFVADVSPYVATGGSDLPDAKSYNDDARGFGFTTREWEGERYVTSAVLYLPQAPERIKFQRGSVSSEVTGTLNSYGNVRTYLIRVRKGQTIRTEQISGSSISITITDPNGTDVEGDSDASCNNRRKISPTVAGDYYIEVVECRKADEWRGRFTFRVTVR